MSRNSNDFNSQESNVELDFQQIFDAHLSAVDPAVEALEFPEFISALDPEPTGFDEKVLIAGDVEFVPSQSDITANGDGDDYFNEAAFQASESAGAVAEETIKVDQQGEPIAMVAPVDSEVQAESAENSNLVVDGVALSDEVGQATDELALDDEFGGLEHEFSSETLAAFQELGASLQGAESPDPALLDDEQSDSEHELSLEVDPVTWQTVGVESDSFKQSSTREDASLDGVEQLGEQNAAVNSEADGSAPLPAGGFGVAGSATEFLSNGHSMNDLVREMAAANLSATGPMQSAVAGAATQAPHIAHNPSPNMMSHGPSHHSGNVVGQAHPAPGHDNRVGLLGAGMMLGAKGIQALGSMVSSGGRAVSEKVSDFSFGAAEKNFKDALSTARGDLAQMKLNGLSVLEDPSLDAEQKREILKQYLAKMENQESFDRLVGKIDQMSDLSRKLIKQGITRGMDGDSVMNRAIEPMDRFLKDNEDILKNLHSGDKTLYERLEGAVSSLLEALRDVLLHVQSMFQGSDQKQSAPRLG